jgi:hypothetical protein
MNEKLLKNLCFLFFISFLSTNTYAETIYTLGTNNFKLINPSETRNIIGNTQIIGNTVECVTSKRILFGSDNNLACSNDLKKNDNNYIIKYIDIDKDTSTFNSSSATLQLPNTYSDIAWVGLFWQGHINNYSYQSSIKSKYSNYYYNYYIQNNYYDYFYNKDYGSDSDAIYFNVSNDYTNNNIKQTKANQLLLKVGNSQYTTITADKLNYLKSSRKIGLKKY